MNYMGQEGWRERVAGSEVSAGFMTLALSVVLLPEEEFLGLADEGHFLNYISPDNCISGCPLIYRMLLSPLCMKKERFQQRL